MSSHGADICVIVPSYNSSSTILRAVHSALAQPEAAEILVVDDASQDGAADLVRGEFVSSSRVRLLRLSENGGPSAARNLGIASSSAPWIAILDADDYFLPGRLALLRAQADDWDFVADDLARSRGPEDAPRTWLIGDAAPLPSRLGFSQFVRANISRRGAPRKEFGFLKPLMRRSFLEAHDLVYDERLRLGEDFILYARALALGARFKLVEPCGYLIIERDNSLSVGHGAEELAQLAQASKALLRLKLNPDQRRAVRAHTHHVRSKLQLRRVLETKRRSLAHAALQIARAPHLLPYVLMQGGFDAAARRLRGKPVPDSPPPLAQEAT